MLELAIHLHPDKSGHLRQRRTLTANSLSASLVSMALMSPAGGRGTRRLGRVRGWMSILETNTRTPC